ncbi:MAG: zinc metallopeptidase [bacterium]
MPLLILAVLLLALVFGPQMWARYTFRRYAAQNDAIPGTGAELARHLLERFEMPGVGVEKGPDGGDHYDPVDRVVRLSPDYYDGKSLTAVAVAAHEVGHAIQHHRQEAGFQRRVSMVKFAAKAQQIGSGAMLLLPVVMLLLRTPVSGLLMFAIGLLSLGTAAMVHLLTLPVELDASFGKALPILREGYIPEDAEPAVRSILKAAAYTYLAASLASLLNIGRWVALLRR